MGFVTLVSCNTRDLHAQLLSIVYLAGQLTAFANIDYFQRFMGQSHRDRHSGQMVHHIRSLLLLGDWVFAPMLEPFRSIT